MILDFYQMGNQVNYLQDFLNFFTIDSLGPKSPFQVFDAGFSLLDNFNKNLLDDLDKLDNVSKNARLFEIEYALKIKLSEYNSSPDTIQFWLREYNVNHSELIKKPYDNELVKILSAISESDYNASNQVNPYFANIQEDFCFYWLGWHILKALKIVETAGKDQIFNKNTKVPYEPINYGESVAKNEIPTVFYKLFKEGKIISSKANVIKMIMTVFRDKDGNTLSESSLNDIFNDSKISSRSKKV